jgi:hypothetical protein
MRRKPSSVSAGGSLVIFLVVLNAMVLEQGFAHDARWYRIFPVTLPLLLIVLFFNRHSAR